MVSPLGLYMRCFRPLKLLKEVELPYAIFLKITPLLLSIFVSFSISQSIAENEEAELENGSKDRLFMTESSKR